MKKVACCNCKKEVGDTEVALNLKLLGKHIGNFRCFGCLSVNLNCDRDKLIRLAQHYKDSGCILFMTIESS
ncbi:MAG: hypothetical protein K0R46_735 [Herbinix sp.]|jgi:hypothetical protein|nr:hypothetical protein [Herbinix sp.]